MSTKPSATDRFFVAPVVNGLPPAGRTLNLAGAFTVTEQPDEDQTTLTFTGGGGATPSGTGFRHVTSGTEDGASKLVADADVASNAAIALSKLAPASAAYVPVMNGSGSAWVGVAISGDASISSLGVVTVGKVNGTSVPAGGALTTGHVPLVTGAAAISYGYIANANVDAAAAIAGTKVAPDFGSQNVTTTGDVLLGATPRSTTGYIRLPNAVATIIAIRDNSNSSDWDLIKQSAAAHVWFGNANVDMTYAGYSIAISAVGTQLISLSGLALDISGGLRLPITVVGAANYVIDASRKDYTVTLDCNAAGRALTFPSAAAHPGRILVVVGKNAGTNTITITPSAGTVEGGATFTMGGSGGPVRATFQSDGTSDWVRIA